MSESDHTAEPSPPLGGREPPEPLWGEAGQQPMAFEQIELVEARRIEVQGGDLLCVELLIDGRYHLLHEEQGSFRGMLRQLAEHLPGFPRNHRWADDLLSRPVDEPRRVLWRRGRAPAGDAAGTA